jgi:ribonuclease III
MDLSLLQEKIGHSFKKTELLKQALTHSSYANEHGAADNETLEFLGDSIIGFLISEYLFENFPEKTEGELSMLKSALVSSNVLGEIAGSLDIGACLLLGKGEELTGGRQKISILAGALEAVAAAVYIDGGFNDSKNFVLGRLEKVAEKLNNDAGEFRHKGLLQEYIQSEYGVIPDYNISDEVLEGEYIFSAVVSVNGKILGSGKGKSKKKAESEAARQALERFGICGPQRMNQELPKDKE